MLQISDGGDGGSGGYLISDLNPRAGLSEKMDFSTFYAKVVGHSKLSAWARWRRAFFLLYFEDMYEGSEEGAEWGDAVTFGEKVWCVSEKTLRRDMFIAGRFRNTLNIDVPFNIHELISIDDEFWHVYLLNKVANSMRLRDTTIDEIKRDLKSLVSTIKAMIAEGNSNEEIVDLIENGYTIEYSGDSDGIISEGESDDEGDTEDAAIIDEMSRVLTAVGSQVINAISSLGISPSEAFIVITVKRRGL